MKRSLIILTIAVLAIILAFIFLLKQGKKKNIDDFDSAKPMMSEHVVESYLQYTLGSISGAVDYEKAKEYLTPELRAQFTSPAFVPESYCVQEGPEEVRLHEEEFRGSTVGIKVSGKYGTNWQEMWEFTLVPNQDSSSWLINSIVCLQE